MKIAHLIMAHQNPFQLERLAKRLEHPECHVFIHLDKKANIQDFEYLKRIKNVTFISKRIKCNWGGFSFVKAITRSVREILLKEEEYDFINLLSAQDYPIKSVNHIYAYLEKHKDKSFISYDESNESIWWKHAVTRYELYHFTDINIKGRYLVQRMLNNIMPKRKFPLSYKLYGSSNSSWWILNRDCAQYVINFLDTTPKLLKFMGFTWGSDEFLYATIIMNSPYKEKTVNNNLRFIEWEEGKPNPRILKNGDLVTLKNTEDLFARKFDMEVDVKVLDELDVYIDNTIQVIDI